MENNALIDALPLWDLFIAIASANVSRRKKRQLGRWSELRLVYSPSFLRSHLSWHPAASITEHSYCLMNQMRSGRPTCAGLLPEWGEEVRRLLRDYIGHRLDAVRSGDVTEGIRRSENIQQ